VVHLLGGAVRPHHQAGDSKLGHRSYGYRVYRNLVAGQRNNNGGLGVGKNQGKQVQFAALVDSLATKKDGSIKVVIETQELHGQSVAELLEYRQKPVYVTLTESAVDEVEVPDEPVEKGRKTQGQRLRAVLYLVWESKGRPGDPEDYYRRTMEKLIEQYKEKLD
jgi:hypothetical protein